mmetsp:Transcript_31235/g.73090  ORF Transcript_31235/g.73090 Transcript_31235/m.73090 type:complete len:484 (-) Transcript_31235:12-1463(-)
MLGRGRAMLARAVSASPKLLARRKPAFHGGRHSSSNASGWNQEAVAVWGGRAVGSLAAGALVLANLPKAECKAVKPDYKLSWDWKGLEDAIVSEVEIECEGALRKLGSTAMDPVKLQEAWMTVKEKQPKNSKLKGSELGPEGFAMVLANLGMDDAETAKTLFKVFDKDNSGAVDFEEWSLALEAMSSKDAKIKMRALFQFCDLNGDGKVTRQELGHSLTSLFNVVSKLTGGKFLRTDLLQKMLLTENEMAAACVEHALIDIFQDPYRDVKAGKEDLSFEQFSKWITSESPSAKTFNTLFDLLGGSLVVSNIEHHPWYEMQPERYGAYAFLVKRFAQLQKASRYLAYTSDVGEAFRPVVPAAVVNASYAVAVGYVAWDVYSIAKAEEKIEGGNVTRAAVHRTVFQGVASIGMPFLIIHTAVHMAHKQIHKHAPKYLKWGPTIIGLILIPALPFICDEPSEYVIDKVFDVAWPHEYPPGAKPHHH